MVLGCVWDIFWMFWDVFGIFFGCFGICLLLFIHVPSADAYGLIQMTTIDRTTIFGGWIETTKPSIRLAHFADVSITDQ
jgi:hypothetical protein